MLTVPVSSEAAAAAIQPLQFGPYTLDIKHCTVRINGQTAVLTPFEAQVLACLAEKPGEVVSKRDINERLYSGNPGARALSPHSNGVEVFVRRLRTKLDPANVERPIETIRGQGYKLRRWENRAAA